MSALFAHFVVKPFLFRAITDRCIGNGKSVPTTKNLSACDLSACIAQAGPQAGAK